jgi:energy-coupling factor transport system substrate-specific component
MVVRWIAALVAFLLVAFVGIVGFNFEGDAAGDAWALVAALALLVAFVVYAAVEFIQTHAFTSITSQFGMRTLALMPFAIAINIILGAAVANALKIPIYLDSIGTILVAALAGPIPGAITGFLANILWQYVIPPPFQGAVAAPFAIVAAVIGLMAGLFARAGWLRPRPNSSGQSLVIGAAIALGVVVLLSLYAYTRFYTETFEFFNAENENAVFTILGWLIVGILVAFVVGMVALLFVRRDVSVAYVTIAGVLTGVVAALISAPISANLFSGVTGSGTDFLVAAFRQAGSDINAAAFQQGLLSDPVDKVVTFFVVYVILSAMARRVKARFPQGEFLLEETDQPTAEEGEWRGAPA